MIGAGWGTILNGWDEQYPEYNHTEATPQSASKNSVWEQSSKNLEGVSALIEKHRREKGE